MFSILTNHGEALVQFLIYEGFQNDIVELLLLVFPMKMVFLSTPASLT